MKTIRSILRKFSSLFLITGLLLGAFAVRVVFASFDSSSSILSRQKTVIGALRIDQIKRSASNSSRISAGQGETATATEVQPGGDHGVDATATIAPTEVGGMRATSTPIEVEKESEVLGVVSMMDSTSLVVNGVVIHIDASTEGEGNIEVGSMVKVEGSLQPDGSILAREVKALKVKMTAAPTVEPTIKNTPSSGDDNPEDKNGKDEENNDLKQQGKVEFVGQITAINGNTWTINGMTVMISDRTEIKGDARVGEPVKVEGVTLTDSSIQANEIKANERGKNREHAGRTPEVKTEKTPVPTTDHETTPTVGSQQGSGEDHGRSGGGDHGGGDSGGDHGGGGHDGGDDGGGHH